MLTRLRNLCLSALLLCPLAGRADEPPEASDISPVKAKLKVLEDGKKHYIVLQPFADPYEHFYYGDGKEFWLQRVRGGGRSGEESFDRSFWEPRVDKNSSFGFRNGKYTLDCGDRTTEFKPLTEGDAGKILDAAKFWKARWKRQAYALARDNTGKYYYVDRMREPEGNKNFRLYVGPKGSMKIAKMTNVVSDSAGDIFATKTGELRLVLNKSETMWMKAKAQTKLIFLPIDSNVSILYTVHGL